MTPARQRRGPNVRGGPVPLRSLYTREFQAAENESLVVTADLDYPRLLASQRADGPGVILFRGGSYSDDEMLGLLDRVLGRAAELELEHSITVIDRKRVRRRRLPVG